MNRTTVALLTDRFAGLNDPRTGRAKRHKFIDVLAIAICTVICGADSWVDVEMYGKSKKRLAQPSSRAPQRHSVS